MSASRFKHYAMAFLCSGMVLASLYSLSREMGVFLNLPSKDREITIAAAEERLPNTLSSFSSNMLLQECYKSLNGVYSLLLAPTEQRVAHFKHCRDRALGITAYHPTMGLGWLVAALASSRLEDEAAFQTYFSRSYDVAPNEGWLARRRILVLINRQIEVSEQNLEVMKLDFFAIMSGEGGVSWTANIYARNSSLRSIITEQADQMEDRKKKAFLRELKKKLR